MAIFGKFMPEVISSVVNGRDATVFAYGTTGAGKTHTMMGPSGKPHLGLISLTLTDLFRAIEDEKGDGVRF